MSFKDEVKKDLKRFTDPVKQDVKNARDDIADAIYDSAHKKESGGCLWSIIKWILILSVLSAVLSRCGVDNNIPRENNGETPTLSAEKEYTGNNELSFIEKQLEYAVQNNIDLHRFPKQEEKLAYWLNNSNADPVYLTIDNIFGSDKYKITENYDGYLYCGELKDNRPDGYGILLVAPENNTSLFSYEDRAYVCRYIGQFSDGRYHGFGILFTESESGLEFLSRLRPYNETTGENVVDFLTWANYAEYIGEFSDGYKDGLGNSFTLPDMYVGTFENALSKIDLDHPNYSVEVGEYKKDKLNGANRQYVNGYLYYEGDSKDDMFDGYGVLYYYGTSIPAYKGEFKKDMRHGTGTSYNEEGEVIYQGEWKNDDYK